MSTVTTRFGNRELRGTGTTYPPIPTWTEWLGMQSASGINVTLVKALGLVNVGVAIKFLAETIASLPLCVYEGEEAERVKARDSWQWRLLYESPNPDCSAFDFQSDIAASIESCGNAFVRKIKAPARRSSEVLALYFMDPSSVVVKRDDRGRKVFKIGPPTMQDREKETLTSAQVLHFRGFTPKGGDVGVSPISQYSNVLGTALAGQEFQGRYYANDTTPSSYMSIPGRGTAAQAKQIQTTWSATHGGVANSGKMGVLFDGAELKTLGVPLKDAQFVESQEFSAEQVARIFLGPAASLLGADANMKTEEESLRFLKFALMPRLRRIEESYSADPDMFPDEEGPTELYPKFYIDEFLRSDAATQAQVQHAQIQDGVLLVDEARAEMGKPPLPDGVGKVPQITPVGGAPNPAMAPMKQPPPEE